jgi:hypothetical protein
VIAKRAEQLQVGSNLGSPGLTGGTLILGQSANEWSSGQVTLMSGGSRGQGESASVSQIATSGVTIVSTGSSIFFIRVTPVRHSMEGTVTVELGSRLRPLAFPDYD